MKAIKLITIIPLTAALVTGTAHAQGNPHMDIRDETQKVARFQGNPHLGYEDSGRVMARYRGNPHEGYISKVVHVAGNQGNPHAGFRLVPLTVASAE